MKYFLLVYHRTREQLVETHTFPMEDRSAALKTRRDLQRRYYGVPELEVVLLGAERFEDLQRTHRRYFRKSADIMQTVR